jgi:hypothetical protein
MSPAFSGLGAGESTGEQVRRLATARGAQIPREDDGEHHLLHLAGAILQAVEHAALALGAERREGEDGAQADGQVIVP